MPIEEKWKVWMWWEKRSFFWGGETFFFLENRDRKTELIEKWHAFRLEFAEENQFEFLKWYLARQRELAYRENRDTIGGGRHFEIRRLFELTWRLISLQLVFGVWYYTTRNLNYVNINLFDIVAAKMNYHGLNGVQL